MNNSNVNDNKQAILQGIRVLELGGWIVGPLASLLLAELGAEVIKIEPPGRGDAMRGWTHGAGGVSLQLPGGLQPSFEADNHSKLGIVLNLKKAKGREVLYKLAEKSDVLITNMLPRALAELGVDYRTLCQHNPKIILASSTCFGERGARSDAPGFDLMAQAASGIMYRGDLHSDPKDNVWAIGDHVGALWLAFGVLAALLGKERLGIGQEVATSQLGGLMFLQRFLVLLSLFTGDFEISGRNKRVNPLYNWYKCKCGQWIALGMMQSDRYYSTFCRALGVPSLEKDPRFENANRRRENSEELISILDGVFAGRTREEWMVILEQAGLICSPINSIPDLLHDPQVLDNEYIVNFDHPTLGQIRFPGHPSHFSKTPARISGAAPHFGEHTGEVLSRICRYTWEEIAKLAEEEVI